MGVSKVCDELGKETERILNKMRAKDPEVEAYGKLMARFGL